METEIKLAAGSDEELYSIINREWFIKLCPTRKPSSVAVLNNTYFDTPDFALRNKRGSLRVRIISTDSEQTYEHTVKFGSKCENGLYQRYEWNVPRDNDIIDMNSFIDYVSKDREQADSVDILRNYFKDVDCSLLKGFCSTVVKRTIYDIVYKDSRIEACFDSGMAVGGSKTSVICELELELVNGSIDDLLSVAKIVEENSDFVPSNESKFKKCLNLLGIEK